MESYSREDKKPIIKGKEKQCHCRQKTVSHSVIDTTRRGRCQKRNRKNDTWHVTFDIWRKTHHMLNLTCDMWRVTSERLHVTSVGRWTFSPNFSSLALTVWEWRCVKDILSRYQWSSNYLINNKGVCRRRKKPVAQTAGADPSQCNFTNRQNPAFQVFVPVLPSCPPTPPALPLLLPSCSSCPPTPFALPCPPR